MNSTAWSAATPPATGKIQATYEPELFELAYTVFMANSNPAEAMAVAERALEAHPSDTAWLTRAAQAAEWSDRPVLALTHWFHLAENNNQKARQSALRLSRALNELPLRKRLLEQMLNSGNNDIVLLKEYITVAEGMGLPQEAYTMVTSGRIHGHYQYLLMEQARLAETLGRPAIAIAVWIKISMFRPLLPDENLRLASLWYGQRNLDQAWQTLKKGASSAPPSAIDFWRAYADLAWGRQELSEAAHASRLLLDHGNASESDYQRLIIFFQSKNPQQAHAIALLGWQRFHTPLYWYVIAETGISSGREKELVVFLKRLTTVEQEVLAKDAKARMQMAQLYRQVGDILSSLAEAKAAMQLDPDNGEIATSYLWLLIDLQRTDELRRVVREWEWRMVRLPELREPLAAAMMLLGDAGRALRHYRVLAPERQSDPAWLASYGDVLEQAGHPEAAWAARRQAQRLVVRHMRTATNSPETARRDLLTRAQLLMQLAPGDTLRSAIQRIADDKQDDSSRGLIMAWAMSSGQNDLARFWYWRALARTAQRLEWAKLGLALEENDLTAVAELIEADLDKLPYRDAVEGARRSGQIPLAETIAFERFQINDRDHLLDKQIRELFDAHPAALRQRLTLQKQGGIGFFEETTSLSYPATKRFSLLAELNNTEIRHQKSGVLWKYPSSIQSAMLGLQLLHGHGSTKLTGGFTDALYSFASLELATDWRLHNSLVLDLGLRYGWQASESVQLKIGGLKDEASIGLSAALTPRDSIATRLTYRNLRDQERHYLGNGLSLEGEATHKILVDWPDTNLRLYSGYHSFKHGGTLTGKTLEMNPSGDPTNTDFYVPESFAQIGTGINFGQYYKNSYGRQWLPFGGVDLSWSSTSGAGFRYELGVAGPVFGLDKLESSFSQESGRFGNSEINTRIDIKYLYNLN